MNRVASQHQLRSINFGGVLVDPASYLGGTTHSYPVSSEVHRLAKREVTRSTHEATRSLGDSRSGVVASDPKVAPPSQASRPAFLGAAALLAFTLAMVVHAQVARADATAPVVQRSGSRQLVVVRSGDSIWSIARSVQPAGDVRALVDMMVAERDSPVVFVGDVLSVPTP